MRLFNKEVFISVLTLVMGAFLISSQALSQEESTAAVTGTVIDVISEEPIEGVEVTIPDLELSATTNVEGTFSFESVEPGTYTVKAEIEGYENWKKEVEVIEEGKTLDIQLEPVGR